MILSGEKEDEVVFSRAENGEQKKLRPRRREREAGGRKGGWEAKGFRLPFLHVRSASNSSQAVSGLDIAHKWTIGAPFICSLILSEFSYRCLLCSSC